MGLPKLNAALLKSGHSFPSDLAVAKTSHAPEKVIQFGEGNFLRGFVDWMLHRMNRQGLFNGRAVLVQPIAEGLSEALNAQDGLYTLILRGLTNGTVLNEREIISSVSRCINPYADHASFLALADQPEMRFVVSNTTEAGIRVDPKDRLSDAPPASFPGKLTQLLYRRFKTFAGDRTKGLVMLPCELIERNGDNLRRAVCVTALRWDLERTFLDWIDGACVFTNTLVDRIVTGYPGAEASALTTSLGYEDRLLDTAEVFHLWVIEGPAGLRSELPLVEAGLDVVWTEDMTPYRERKVRILNGAHTAMVLAAYLDGKNIVRECLEDPTFKRFLEHCIHDEIFPTLDLPKHDLESFASAVIDRFANPFIDHQLLSISLNSVSKYKARILATVRDYQERTGKPPERLAFALAALIAFYRGTEIRDGALVGMRGGVEYRIQDDPAVLSFFAEAWRKTSGRSAQYSAITLVAETLGCVDLWGVDLSASPPGFAPRVAVHLHAILADGIRAALERLG